MARPRLPPLGWDRSPAPNARDPQGIPGDLAYRSRETLRAIDPPDAGAQDHANQLPSLLTISKLIECAVRQLPALGENRGAMTELRDGECKIGRAKSA